MTLTLSAGATGEQLAQQTIGPGEEFRLTLPQDGWYLLDKQVAGSDESIASLAATGIYPIFDRNFIRDGTRVYQYVRSTDRLLIEDGRPRDADDEDLPMLGIIEHQYKGRRSTADFLRLMLAPFLQQLNLGLTLFVAVMAAGYYGAKWLERRDQGMASPAGARAPRDGLVLGSPAAAGLYPDCGLRRRWAPPGERPAALGRLPAHHDPHGRGYRRRLPDWPPAGPRAA